MINTLLNNRYLIIEVIGSGGMATVYKAQDQLLDRIVAVKVLHHSEMSNEDAVRKFLYEARSAGGLTHFNIVSVYDYGEQDDIYYIVMELVDGQTLREYMPTKQALEIDKAVDFAIQICDGLQHAHSKGVIHRDIKPENIIVTSDGNIKVADFGIARAVTSDTLTRSKDVYGSVRYFSPEQASGDSANAQSDMYSLGMVLYEMLSGTLPFEGDTPIAWAMKHINAQPKELTQANSEIAQELSDIVMKTLQKDPDDRFQDINELKQALMMFKQGLPVQFNEREHKSEASQTNMPVKALNKKKRNPILITVAVIAALIIVGGVYGYNWLSNYLDVGEVEVPSLVGVHIQVATAMLEERGLTIEVMGTQKDETLEANYVIKQDPSEGSIVKEGRVIGVTLSEGAEYSAVPNIGGVTLAEAEVLVFNANLQVGEVIERYSDDIPADHVMMQNPRPDTMVKANTTIDIVISLGPEFKSTKLPDLTGLTSENAYRVLQQLELAVGAITEIPSDKPAGTVVGQTIPAGTEVLTGAKIGLVVSNGRTP